ncbi:hypothetical protein PAXRUDRAFT_826695 [Paxillus rubicundulus Ve08.2h10]|uniref:Uncharacterized protein n=1 Tax=Paxillus rubicundulus Ve08.2h10 TaxID=930991 RepID=A0A0D0E9G5_9AGAM|nr:hypothetical protein PAXRUDRAFT_826695 [Paxillus rubicundulus Ve08.2h10]
MRIRSDQNLTKYAQTWGSNRHTFLGEMVVQVKLTHAIPYDTPRLGPPRASIYHCWVAL